VDTFAAPGVPYPSLVSIVSIVPIVVICPVHRVPVVSVVVSFVTWSWRPADCCGLAPVKNRVDTALIRTPVWRMVMATGGDPARRVHRVHRGLPL